MNYLSQHRRSILRGFPILIFSAVVLLNLLGSCTQAVTNIELPFDEKLLIEGVLEAGKPLENISITKTYPPLTTRTSISTLYLPGAEITLRVDGQSYKPQVRLDSLQYSTNNGFGPAEFRYITTPKYSFPGLIATPGKVYELTVKWNGKTAVGRATVPTAIGMAMPTISATSITRDSLLSGGRSVNGQFVPTYQTIARINLSATATAKEGYAYRLSLYSPDTASTQKFTTPTFSSFNPSFVSTSTNWTVLPEGIREDRSVFNLVVPVSPSRVIVVGTSGPGQDSVQSIPDLTTHLKRLRYYVVFTATEMSYNKWDATKYFGFSYGGGFPFSGSGGQNPTWNIEGDGIGIFVGAQSQEIPVVLR